MGSVLFYPIFMYAGIEITTLFCGYIKLTYGIPSKIVRKICHEMLVLTVYVLFLWLNMFEFCGNKCIIISFMGSISSIIWSIEFILPHYIQYCDYKCNRNIVSKLLLYKLNGFLRDSDKISDVLKATTIPMTIGSLMVGITVAFLWYYDVLNYFRIIFVLMAFPDGFGELVPNIILHLNKNYKLHGYKYWDYYNNFYHNKTLEGNMAIFIVTFITLIMFNQQLCCNDVLYIKRIIISILLTFIEGISPKGLDNVILFQASILVVYLFRC